MRFIASYFNYVYNPVYDSIVGRLHHYQKLQSSSIGRLSLRDGDRVLCIGVGTGNELLRIRQANQTVRLVGIDFSTSALARARRKTAALAGEIILFHMDATRLDFPAGAFDKAVCFHVMDFVSDIAAVTGQILRVLKEDGEFIITYPSKREGISSALELLKEDISHRSDNGRSHCLPLRVLAMVSLGMVYLPLLFRRGRRSYQRAEIEGLFGELNPVSVDEDSLYGDYIVWGKKTE